MTVEEYRKAQRIRVFAEAAEKRGIDLDEFVIGLVAESLNKLRNGGLSATGKWLMRWVSTGQSTKPLIKSSNNQFELKPSCRCCKFALDAR